MKNKINYMHHLQN